VVVVLCRSLARCHPPSYPPVTVGHGPSVRHACSTADGHYIPFSSSGAFLFRFADNNGPRVYLPLLLHLSCLYTPTPARTWALCTHCGSMDGAHHCHLLHSISVYLPTPHPHWLFHTFPLLTYSSVSGSFGPLLKLCLANLPTRCSRVLPTPPHLPPGPCMAVNIARMTPACRFTQRFGNTDAPAHLSHHPAPPAHTALPCHPTPTARAVPHPHTRAYYRTYPLYTR